MFQEGFFVSSAANTIPQEGPERIKLAGPSGIQCNGLCECAVQRMGKERKRSVRKLAILLRMIVRY